MSSVLVTVERTIVAALSAAGSPCSIERAFAGEYNVAALPAINVIPLGWEANERDSTVDSVAIDAEWAVILRAKGTGESPSTDALDPLLVWVWSRVYGDETIAGAVRDLRLLKGAYEYQRTGDVELAQCQVDISASFDVRRSDLSANYNVEG